MFIIIIIIIMIIFINIMLYVDLSCLVATLFAALEEHMC